MQTSQVLVAGIFWPKAGKKNGTIKGSDEQLYSAPANLLQGLQQGISYMITWKPNSFNGQTYKMVESIAPIQGGQIIQQQPQQSAPPSNYPPQQPSNYPPQQVAQTPRPQQAAAPAGRYSAVSDRERQEHIFVCGALNAMLRSPHKDVDKIDAAWVANKVRHLRTAWANTLGAKQADDDMQDEIPEFR